MAPLSPVLLAPPHWGQVDFISDLHLQAGEPATFDAWRDFMQTTPADAVFILGDLFEVWVGDDVLDLPGPADSESGFEARCAKVLQEASRRLAVFFMHGNRDFLLGAAFAQSCGMTLLGDPTVLDFAGQRWLLSHGDALCLDDTDYMRFRAQVRSAPWQQDFLAQPRAQRQELARNLRNQSELRKRSAVSHVDLDPQTTCHWLHAANAGTLIHGHTHRPAEHALPDGLRRIVLSDWDAYATPPRADVVRLSKSRDPNAQGALIQRLTAVLAA